MEITSKDHPEYTAVIFHIDLVDKAPQVLNDFPSECNQNSEPDDTEYESLDFEAGELLGYGSGEPAGGVKTLEKKIHGQ